MVKFPAGYGFLRLYFSRQACWTHMCACMLACPDIRHMAVPHVNIFIISFQQRVTNSLLMQFIKLVQTSLAFSLFTATS